MIRAKVRRNGNWWTVTYNDQPHGRMRSWQDAIRHANCVTVLKRRNEP